MKKTIKAFLLFIGTIASFFVGPAGVIYLFDWLDIYSDSALLICSIIAVIVPLIFIFKIAIKSGNEVREQKQKKEAETSHE